MTRKYKRNDLLIYITNDPKPNDNSHKIHNTKFYWDHIDKLKFNFESEWKQAYQYKKYDILSKLILDFSESIKYSTINIFRKNNLIMYIKTKENLLSNLK